MYFATVVIYFIHALKKADRQAAETSANNIFTPTPAELLINYEFITLEPAYFVYFLEQIIKIEKDCLL